MTTDDLRRLQSDLERAEARLAKTAAAKAVTAAREARNAGVVEAMSSGMSGRSVAKALGVSHNLPSQIAASHAAQRPSREDGS